MTNQRLALVLACSSVGTGAVGSICACGAAIGPGIGSVCTGAGDVGLGLFVPVGICWSPAVVLVAFVPVRTGVGIDPFIEDAM